MQRCFEEKRVAFRVNPNPLEVKTRFPYLRRTATYNNSDWTTLYRNLRKAQKKWGVIEKVMDKTGAPIKSRSMMCKAVVQVVLLYGSKI